MPPSAYPGGERGKGAGPRPRGVREAQAAATGQVGLGLPACSGKGHPGHRGWAGGARGLWLLKAAQQKGEEDRRMD